ncbi:MAG: hypothetical protein ACHQAY_12850 [Hyphomicrobiales bacterium]
MPKTTASAAGGASANVIPFGTSKTKTPNLIDGPNAADALSFMARRKPAGSGIKFWRIRPTGSYAEDCTTGANLAAEYLAFLGKYPTVGNGTLLTCIVSEMLVRAIDGEAWSGVHVGFLSEINGYAMSCARFLHEHGGASPDKGKREKADA